MSIKTPELAMLEPPQHFSDYGFDPQFDYFQVLEEARKHKREKPRSIDAFLFNFKLQKPISKDDRSKISKKRRCWWKNAALFFKSKWAAQHQRPSPLDYHEKASGAGAGGSGGGGSVSSPIYITESLSGSTTPYRTTSRSSSGPLAGNGIPYVNLKDLNMVEQQHGIPAPPMPIYLVT